MALEIVWRNPTPPAKAETRVESIAVDELGAAYAISVLQMRPPAFELILGGAA
jgi:hypothetical protein